MKVLIVKKSDLSIASKYEAESPSQSSYGGPWGDPNLHVHLQCSEALDWDCVKAVLVDGEIQIEEDQDLIDVKTEKLWNVLRSMRDSKLLQCDWTQLVDSPLNSQDKSAWAAYRQELRDLPENTEDPASPVWPAVPGQG